MLNRAGRGDEAVRVLQTAALDGAHLMSLAGQQRDDGSWGTQATAPGRILTTLLALRSLTDAGLTDRSTMVAAALDFLAEHAVVSGGGAIWGTRDSVLPCYTGILAEVFLHGGRPGLAEPLLAWISMHQQIRSGGLDRAPGATPWADYLRTRYGGCFASTSCLIGAIAGVSALVVGQRAGICLPSRALTLMDGMRRLLAERGVCHARDGSVLPLAGRTKADPDATRWMAPVFPRSYLPDLLDLIHLAVALEVPADRIAPARARLSHWQLPDGRWVLGGRRTLSIGFRPEPRNLRRPSAWITLRYLESNGGCP